MKSMISKIAALVFLLAFLLPDTAVSGDDYEVEKVKSKLPALFGANNVGKEFWVTIPPCYDEAGGGHDNFIKVFVTSPAETVVNIDVPGKGFHAQKTTVPDDVIEFNITPTIGQCYLRSPNQPAYAEKVYPGYGMHIYADQPIVVYVVIRYYATSDGFLAIPVSSLGREYIMASYGDMGAMYNGRYPSESGIVAAYDKTKVTFTLGGNILTETGGGMKPGDIASKTLNAGDVWLFSSATNEGDLTGSKVVATKPVAVVSGNFCTNIPITNRWCDYTVEMDLPMYTWGLNYHVAKVPGRYRAPLIRVFAKEPNTQIYRDGKAIGYVQQSGGVITKGYLEMRLVPFEAEPRSAVISGDKPIGVTLYNTGVEEDGYPLPNSDPFIMAQTPFEQYQKEITFCTPGIYGGYGFNENYLNLVYQTTESGVTPNDLEFAQVSGGEFVWQPVKVIFSGGDELFQYDVDGKKYAMKTITLPKDGVYKIRAEQPFAAYSFGYAWCDSYGYPTSAALIDVERPDTVAPDIYFDITCEGTVEGYVIDMPDNDTIRVNLSEYVFLREKSINYDMDVEEFEAGMDRETSFNLWVLDQTKDAQATFVFSDRNGNERDTTIIYKAVKIDLNKTTNFSLVEGKTTTYETGDQVTRDFWAVNRSLESDVEITRLWLKSNDPDPEVAIEDQGFDLLDISLPFTIPANDSVAFRIRFTADEAGYYVDSVGIGDTCIFEYLIQVSAIVGNPGIHVDSAIFQQPVTVDYTSSPKNFTIQNTSDDVDLIITDYQWASSSQGVFTWTDAPEISTEKPLVITVEDKEKTFTLMFTPNKADAEFRDSIFFTSNAGEYNDDHICEIYGTSTQPGISGNGYDWGKLRILRASHVPHNDANMSAPYKYDMALYVFNTGSEDLTITDVEPLGTSADLIGNTVDYVFQCDLGDLRSKKINVGDTIFLPVTFRPKDTTDYAASLEISAKGASDKTIYYTASLSGTGIVPMIEVTPVIDFDTTLVNDNVLVQEKDFVIKNLEYTYQDDLTITDYAIIGGEISDNLGTPGTKGFSIENTLPETIAPGEDIIVKAQFVAQQDGPVSTVITTVSDAIEDKSSDWSGYGISEAISTESASVTTCIYDPKIIEVSVKNEGTAPIDNITPAFNPVIPEIRLVDPTLLTTGFSLAPQEEKVIQVEFDPNAAGIYETDLVYDNNSTQLGLQDHSDINCEAKAYYGQIVIDNSIDKVHVGDKNLWFNISYDFGDVVPEYASLENINFDLKYQNEFMQVMTVDVNSDYSDNLNISYIIDQEGDQDGGVVHFSIATKAGGKINAPLNNLFDVKYQVNLPRENAEAAVIAIDNIEINEQCYTITGDQTQVELYPICVEDLMHIDDILGTYHLDEIAPNPVSGNGADITFGIGLPAWTKVAIYNDMGEEIATPISDHLQAGDYSFRLPIENIPSGTYTIRLESAHKTITKRLVIQK